MNEDLTYVPCQCLECEYEALRERVPCVEPCASCPLGPESGWDA